jgi:hypothetical protein
MPNPFHYRATIDRHCRLAAPSNPGYVRLRSLKVLANELAPDNPRSDLIQHMLQVAEPYEFARHKLRDLYDHAALPPLASGEGPSPQEDEPTEEDDDPL